AEARLAVDANDGKALALWEKSTRTMSGLALRLRLGPQSRRERAKVDPGPLTWSEQFRLKTYGPGCKFTLSAVIWASGLKACSLSVRPEVIQLAGSWSAPISRAASTLAADSAALAGSMAPAANKTENKTENESRDGPIYQTRNRAPVQFSPRQRSILLVECKYALPVRSY